jgi:NitT/TauT family transport system ATP-binding protein
VGTSGCGKSTFLRLLLGQETASKGTILLDGQPLAGEPDASRGVVFQRYSVFPHLSVLDNVALGLELPRSPWLGRLFGKAKKAAREQAAVLLHKSASATRWTNTRRSSPAACSNAWPSPRR